MSNNQWNETFSHNYKDVKVVDIKLSTDDILKQIEARNIAEQKGLHVRDINKIDLNSIDVEKLTTVEELIYKIETKLKLEGREQLTDEEIHKEYLIVRKKLTCIYKEKNYEKLIDKIKYFEDKLLETNRLNRIHKYYVNNVRCRGYCGLKDYNIAKKFGEEALKYATPKESVNVWWTMGRLYQDTDINRAVYYMNQCINYYESDEYTKDDKEKNIAFAKLNIACYTKDIDLSLELVENHERLYKNATIETSDLDDAYESLLDAYLYNNKFSKAYDTLHNIKNTKLCKKKNTEILNRIENEKHFKMIVNN